MADELNQEIEQEQQEPHGEEQQSEIDWKAMARKWERIAKDNKEAAQKLTELESESNARVSELEERAAKAEQEAADLRHKNDLRQWAEAAAKEHGVPAAILRGSTQEELMEHAAAIKASIQVAPEYRDSGEPKNPPKSSKDVFNDFMNTAFNH